MENSNGAVGIATSSAQPQHQIRWPQTKSHNGVVQAVRKLTFFIDTPQSDFPTKRI
jgi:hypothetical protein